MFKKGLGFILIILFSINCEKSLSEKMIDRMDEVKEILAGEKLIEPGIPESSFTAKELIDEVIANLPDNCEANYLLLLTDLKNLIETLDPVIQVVQTLGYSSGTIPLAGGLVDSIVSGVLLPILDTFDEMDRAVSVIEEKKCSVFVSKYPIKLGMETSPLVDIYLAGYDKETGTSIPGEWDLVEAELIGSFVSLVKAGLHYLLSLDLDLDIESAMDAINEGIINLEGDPLSMIRNLGFIPAQNPDFLNFHPDRGDYYTMVGGDFATAFRRFATFLTTLYNEQDENPYDDIIAGIDDDGDGKVDRLQFNIFNSESGKREFIVEINGVSTDVLSLIESFLPIFVNYDYVQTAGRVLNHLADAFDGTDKNPIYLSDLEPLMLGIVDLPDTLRFYPWKLYPKALTDAVPPPRDLLPYWMDTNGDGFEEFIIEGEVPDKYAQSATDYIFVGDSPHFQMLPPPDAIPQDCIYPDAITLFYIAFQDPSFNGAIETNLSEINNQCSYSEYEGWKQADQFSINVVINHLINTIAPVIEQFMSQM